MHVSLIPYPGVPSAAVERIEVEVERLGEIGLKLTYRVFGDRTRIRLPEIDADRAGRTDELWRHTCFEAFVKAEGREGYLEFNFAPSLQWATYRFTGYREGMAPSTVEPWVVHGSQGDPVWLEVEIEPGRMARPDLPAPAWSLGLSAVIEDVDGNISYWALAHPSDKPDFHHPDSFALVLPPPELP